MAVSTNLLHKPMEEWPHIQHGVYPAYITWDQHLANQARLHQNSTLFEMNSDHAQGAPHQGEALLQGLATCLARMKRTYLECQPPISDSRSVQQRSSN